MKDSCIGVMVQQCTLEALQMQYDLVMEYDLEPKDKCSQYKLWTPGSRKFKILHWDALQKAVDF